MIAFVDPTNDNQVMAVYSDDTESSYWTDQGYEVYPVAPALEAAITRDHQATVTDGVITDLTPNPNPVQPPPRFASDWDHPRQVPDRTFDLITEQFRAAGADALQADDAIQANANIPPEVKDYTRASIQMFYLVYVALTGDRIQSVEDEYFPV